MRQRREHEIHAGTPNAHTRAARVCQVGMCACQAAHSLPKRTNTHAPLTMHTSTHLPHHAQAPPRCVHTRAARVCQVGMYACQAAHKLPQHTNTLTPLSMHTSTHLAHHASSQTVPDHTKHNITAHHITAHRITSYHTTSRHIMRTCKPCCSRMHTSTHVAHHASAQTKPDHTNLIPLSQFLTPYGGKP